jgi:hypothetical protein
MAFENTPWWSNLLTALIFLIVGAATVLYMKQPAAAPTGPKTPSGIGALAVDTLTYTPHILMLFGLLADMLTYQGVYSIASLIGLLSLAGNFVLQWFWLGASDFWTKLSDLATKKSAPAAAPAPAPAPAPAGASKPPPGAGTGLNLLAFGGSRGGGKAGQFFGSYDGCDIQGLGVLRSPYAPQTLVFTATVFSYYIFDLIQNRGWKNATAAIVVFVVLFGGQIAAIGDCTAQGEPSKPWKALISFVEGLLFGGIGYGVVQSYAPSKLPSTAVSPFPTKTASDLKPGPNGGLVDESGNPYVCMANGQCYPDLSTAESRKAFASIAAESLGTGAPATPEDCAADTTS